MADLTTDELRELFIDQIIKTWKDGDSPFYKKAWNTVTQAMQFVGNHKAWSGADKKEEVLKILSVVLDKTDSPGPDFLVDKFIEEAAEFGIDYLYDAFKGKFAFDGPTETEA